MCILGTIDIYTLYIRFTYIFACRLCGYMLGWDEHLKAIEYENVTMNLKGYVRGFLVYYSNLIYYANIGKLTFIYASFISQMLKCFIFECICAGKTKKFRITFLITVCG